MKKEQEKHPRRGSDHEETTRNLSMARPVSDRPEDKNNYPSKPQGRRNYAFTFDEDQARAEAQARTPELPRWVEPEPTQQTPLLRPEPQGQPYEPLSRPQQPAQKPQSLTPLPLDQWKQEQERARREENARSDRVRTRQRRERATRTPTPFHLSCTLLFLLLLAGALALYLLFPENNMILILGLDRSLEEDGWLSRSDTIMLTQVRTMQGEVNMLSIPRDLWVGIPGYGENRINTAHYFAEVYMPGTGAQSAIDTVEANFGVKIKHYVRIKLEEFPRLIDAMGGITVELAEPMGGLEAGTHKLDGTEALKFVRDRSGTDDFYRMRQQQTFVKAVIQRLLNPFTWLRMPLIVGTAMDLVDTDIAVWQWPRMGVALLRAYPDKLTTQTLTRDHVTPYTTAEGANVLLPNWEMILPLVDEMFR